MFVILQSHFFVEVTKFKLKFLLKSLARFIKLRYRSHSQLIERNLYYYLSFEELLHEVRKLDLLRKYSLR